MCGIDSTSLLLHYFFLDHQKNLCFDFRKINLKFEQSLKKSRKWHRGKCHWKMPLENVIGKCNFRDFLDFAQNSNLFFENQNIIFFDDLKKIMSRSPGRSIPDPGNIVNKKISFTFFKY